MNTKVVAMKGKRNMRLSLRPIASFVCFGCLLALCGCQYAPNISILGSFFPAWLLCIVVGILLTAFSRWLLVRMKLATEIEWTIVVYPCLALFFACTLWLIFFGEGL
jgi:hypothetical protein